MVAAAAAWSDGTVCPSEARALDVILDHLGFSDPERTSLQERLAREVTLEEVATPDDPLTRLEMLRYAMAVTLADGSLEDRELDFLRRLVERMGLSQQALVILSLEADKLAAEGGTPSLETVATRVAALLPAPRG